MTSFQLWYSQRHGSVFRGDTKESLGFVTGKESTELCEECTSLSQNTVLVQQQKKLTVNRRTLICTKCYQVGLTLDVSGQKTEITVSHTVRNLTCVCVSVFQSDCVNYVKIVHHYNRTHLYACGTGAFHPTCAYVEVGNKMEVRNKQNKTTTNTLHILIS